MTLRGKLLNKIDPDPGQEHFFIYGVFEQKKNFKVILLLFSLIFELKLDNLLKDNEIFVYLSFFNSSNSGFVFC